MNPRLDSLLRQREVIREHLRWLESEIEVAKGSSSLASTSASSAPGATAPAHAKAPLTGSVEVWPRSSGSAAVPPADATDAIPDEVDVRGLHNEVRRGCMVYAAIAAAALGLIVVFIYWRY